MNACFLGQIKRYIIAESAAPASRNWTLATPAQTT